MPVTIDFTGVSSGFEALETGAYPAKIAKWEVGSSQQSKQPVLSFEYDLTEPAGRKHWETYSLQAKALWRLKGDLVNLGLDFPDGPFELEEWLREQDLIGKEVMLDMTKEPHWQGKQKPDGSPVMVNRATMRAVSTSDSGW